VLRAKYNPDHLGRKLREVSIRTCAEIEGISAMRNFQIERRETRFTVVVRG